MFGELFFLVIGILLVGVGLLFTEGGLLFLLISFGALSFIVALIGIYNHTAEKNAPLITVQARVFAKTTKTSGGDTYQIGDGQFSSDSITTKHYISFEFDKRRENFEVDVTVYNTVLENDKGVLEYKDIQGVLKFISFQRQV